MNDNGKIMVIKRNGKVVEFDLSKIKDAITKAFDACDKNYHPDVIDFLALKVTSDSLIQEKLNTDKNRISVEDIQDAVERTLIRAGYDDVAKAYILYRKLHEKLRNVNDSLINYKNLVNSYLKVSDWRVKENSTVTYSVGGLILSNSGAVTANYWLSEIYDDEIAKAHKDADIHIHDLSMLTGYCAGWSLRQLIEEGLGGVQGKITSAPAKHLSTLCNQMVNFLGIMQNEWAGAQAFSSFDTYLAPFVKADNLKYNEVKQCIQSFVYGVNTPSRWGCVPIDTEVLSVDGFKKYNELKEGDKIYTWNMKTHNLEINTVNKVIIKPFKGNLHTYSNSRGYIQTVTPNHRTLVYKHNSNEAVIKKSEEIIDVKTPFGMPTKFAGSVIPDIPLSDNLIKLAAMFYADGSINFRGKKTKIVPKFFNMSQRQAELFLRTWAENDGDKNKFKIQCDNEEIINDIQQIAVLAGYTSYVTRRNKTTYVKIRKYKYVLPKRSEEEYDGIVWCPNVDNGTAVFRRNGNVFISGQTQAPFSNITLDWTVPFDLADKNCIVGGKELDFKYKDCQNEMDMINKAFIETMIEGDANGRGFQYPIPTYSITKDFDWSDTENNRLLFEMTSKYGTPYFSNYINSDMEPNDVRSMCPLHGKQKVLVMNDFDKEYHISTIENLYKGNKKNKEYIILLNGKPKKAVIHRFDDLHFYKITLANGHSVTVSDNHLNLTLNGIKQTTELSALDYLPFESAETYGEGLKYEDGLFVGAFLGDGTLRDDYAVTLSLNNTTKEDLKERLKKLAVHKYGARITESQVKNNTVNLNFTSKMLRGLIEDYVSKKGIEKILLPKCINRSVEFRKGIVDGLMATDGNEKSRRIYTASPEGVENIAALFASLGIATSVNVDTRIKHENGRLSDNPVYSIRPYNAIENTPKMYKNIYIKKDGYMWFKIKSIEKLNLSNKIGYCFEVMEDNAPYFMLPNGLITHNCRLRLDLRELRKKSGGFFGSGESTGSVGVVTINMPKIAYQADDEKDFYARLDKLMDISARSLKIKRNVITEFMNNDLYPYTKRYLGTLENHFSTIGLVGMNEACLNAKWIRKDLTDEKAQKFAIKVLNHMRERLSDYQEMYGDLYNLEATPAESTSYRLAKHDKAKYPDIITAAKCDTDTPYYTNSSHLPVGYTDDIFTALDIQDNLQTLYTSGTVFHSFLGEKLPDWQSAANLVRKIAENYRLPYYTLSPTYSVCKEHGYLPGEQSKCPVCGEITEVYSRITGYYRPVKNWNDGKSQEYKDRQEYSVSSSSLSSSSFVSSSLPYSSNVSSASEKSQEKKTEKTEGTEKTEKTEKDDIKEIYLIATTTCPNCKIAEKILEKQGIEYIKIYADETPEKAIEFSVKQAPTLVIVKSRGEAEKYTGVSEIKKHINT